MGQLGWLRLLLLVIGLHFALLVSISLAQETTVESPTKTPADTRVAEQLRTQLATQQQEVVELRAQLKTMRRYDSVCCIPCTGRSAQRYSSCSCLSATDGL